MPSCIRRTCCLLLACTMTASAWAADAQAPEQAVWKTQELTFDYVGFTTHYSCEGLRDKVRGVLELLGARRDLSVETFGCLEPGGPERLPSLAIKFSALQPAAAGAGTLDARWKTVSLGGRRLLTGGDCELAEQIRTAILPLFTTRNLQARFSCIPHQETAAGILLTVDVLVPLKEEK